ncbi:MAG: hypothetical protein Q9191_003964 [Dirinaria sp. TL-2023a]
MATKKSPPPCLESLAPEIKTEILRHMPDVHTLKAFVHASPSYHAIYEALRTEILTTATLNTLRQRKIDIWSPAAFGKVTLRNTKYHPYEDPEEFPYPASSESVIENDRALVERLEKLLPRFWKEFNTKDRTVKLSVEDCLVLLQIERYHHCTLWEFNSLSMNRTPLGEWIDAWWVWLRKAELASKGLQSKEILFQHVLFFDDVRDESRAFMRRFYEYRQMYLFTDLSDSEASRRSKYLMGRVHA